MSAAPNKKAANGVGKDDNNKPNDYVIAKVAGAVIGTGIAWSMFKALWPKKSAEVYEGVEEIKEGGEDSSLKETAEGIVSQTVKKFKLPRKGKVSQTYEVNYGDTLYGLARKYGVTVDSIRSANGLEGDVIVVGEKLNIPM